MWTQESNNNHFGMEITTKKEEKKIQRLKLQMSGN